MNPLDLFGKQIHRDIFLFWKKYIKKIGFELWELQWKNGFPSFFYFLFLFTLVSSWISFPDLFQPAQFLIFRWMTVKR